jgi:hypothetical protein
MPKLTANQLALYEVCNEFYQLGIEEQRPQNLLKMKEFSDRKEHRKQQIEFFLNAVLEDAYPGITKKNAWNLPLWMRVPDILNGRDEYIKTKPKDPEAAESAKFTDMAKELINIANEPNFKITMIVAFGKKYAVEIAEAQNESDPKPRSRPTT